MIIQATIHPTATTRGQSSLVHLDCGGVNTALDIDFSPFLSGIPQPHPIALDLLFIASCAYGVDKAVSRDQFAEDKWTRHLDVRIPVTEPDAWRLVGEDLADCLGFLTGDLWSFEFEKANRALIQPRRIKRWRRFRYSNRLGGEAVSLFSGGLDSYIGAIDLLTEKPGRRLALIGHYDGDVGGPGKDQDELADWLEEEFPSRFTRLKCRIGLSEKASEHSYRSRSFLFLALGAAAAQSLGKKVPIIVPENGPIALNPPLIPSRRGACSTRTTHPHFLFSLQHILNRVGLQHEIVNPYRFLTKGEMVKNCLAQELLQQSYPASRSCAKAGHKSHWHDTHARQCGVCVPCLFRRAALNAAGWDNERFGINLADPTIGPASIGKDGFADVRALTAFLFRNDPTDKIRRDLTTNGPILPHEIDDYVAVVERMREEVRVWMASNANELIRSRAGLLVAP